MFGPEVGVRWVRQIPAWEATSNKIATSAGRKGDHIGRLDPPTIPCWLTGRVASAGVLSGGNAAEARGQRRSVLVPCRGTLAFFHPKYAA